MINFTALEVLDIDTDVWDQTGSYQKEGAVAAFLMNIKFMDVEEPEDYSPENVETIMASTSEKEMQTVTSENVSQPNIIAIMNESWAGF